MIRPRPDLVCTAELRLYDHRVRVSMPEAGLVTLRVIGNREPGADRVEFERMFVVR